jgi:Predicted transcriptional regulator
MTTSFTLRLPTELANQLGQLSVATGRSKSFLAVQAMQDFVIREAWQVAEIQKAIHEADAGDFATDDDMNALDAKWGDNAN